MDFRQLESFVSIAKNSSFSKAAKELFLTQPTISNHMQNLEKELKITLIDRSNKQVELTKAGEIFYDYAIEILGLKHKAQFNLGEYTGKIEGTIDVYASTIPQQYFVPSIIKSFHDCYPDIKYRLNHLDSHDIISSIKEQKINYGFAGSHIKDAQLEFVPIMEDELVLVSSPDFFTKKISITSTDLFDLPLILREEGSGTRGILATELKRRKIDIKDLNIVVYSENTSVIKKLVEKGLGCTVLSKIAFEREQSLHTLTSCPIEDLDLRRHFYFIYGKNRLLSPLETNFINYISTNFNINL